MYPEQRPAPATSATIVVGCASLLLATILFVNVVMLSLIYRSPAGPPWVDSAEDLLGLAALSYLVAFGSMLVGLWMRSPIPYVLAALVLAVATGLVAGPQSDVLRDAEISAGWTWSEVPAGMIVPVGIGCVLFALVAAWAMRPKPDRAVGTLVAAVAAAVLFLVASHSSSTMFNAVSGGVCPRAAPVLVFRIQSSLITPDLRLRGARVLRFTANRADSFVVADVQGNGYEGDSGIGVWLIDEPKSGPQDPAPPIYAVNALASSVSTLPDKPMDDATLARLDDCKKEVQREVSGP